VVATSACDWFGVMPFLVKSMGRYDGGGCVLEYSDRKTL
jgi:hypothetical protein